jgi:hypothetical protein
VTDRTKERIAILLFTDAIVESWLRNRQRAMLARCA